MQKGKLIVIEGGEGAGKSTMIKAIKEIFGDKFVFTREPGGSPFAEEIRHLMRDHPLSGDADANTQFGLIWASRASHLKDTIRPALLSGRNVLTDRFDSSTWAYQIYGQQGFHLKDVFSNIQKLVVGDTKPDLYIFLDVLPEVGLKRKSLQTEEVKNHFDNQTIDYHKRVREGFLEFMKTVPSVIVDANKPEKEVREAVISEIQKILNDF